MRALFSLLVSDTFRMHYILFWQAKKLHTRRDAAPVHARSARRNALVISDRDWCALRSSRTTASPVPRHHHHHHRCRRRRRRWWSSLDTHTQALAPIHTIRHPPSHRQCNHILCKISLPVCRASVRPRALTTRYVTMTCWRPPAHTPVGPTMPFRCTMHGCGLFARRCAGAGACWRARVPVFAHRSVFEY